MKKKSLMMATAASPPEQAEELLRAACVHDSGEPDFNPSSFSLSLTERETDTDRQRRTSRRTLVEISCCREKRGELDLEISTSRGDRARGDFFDH